MLEIEDKVKVLEEVMRSGSASKVLATRLGFDQHIKAKHERSKG